MPDNHCVQWGILYLAWVKTPATEKKARETKKQVYINHLQTCLVCKAKQTEMVELSSRAVHPEIESAL